MADHNRAESGYRELYRFAHAVCLHELYPESPGIRVSLFSARHARCNDMDAAAKHHAVKREEECPASLTEGVDSVDSLTDRAGEAPLKPFRLPGEHQGTMF